MSAATDILRVVGRWVKKAESDLAVARMILLAKDDDLSDVVCFHAQQCAEKYVKALLIRRGVDFDKTHDLAALSLLLPEGDRIDLSAEEAEELTSYAVLARYPTAETYHTDDARKAVALAEKVKADVSKRLK